MDWKTYVKRSIFGSTATVALGFLVFSIVGESSRVDAEYWSGWAWTLFYCSFPLFGLIGIIIFPLAVSLGGRIDQQRPNDELGTLLLGTATIIIPVALLSFLFYLALP